jgi:MFS family permease
MIAGLLLLTTVGPHTSFVPTIFLAYFAIGLGAGTSFMPLLTIAMADVPPADAGLASGIINVSQQVSGAIGLAVLSTLAATRTKTLAGDGHGTLSALLGGYHFAFTIAAICLGVGVLLAAAVLRKPARPAANVTPIERAREAALELEAA